MDSASNGPLAPPAGSMTAVPGDPGRGPAEAWAPLIRKTGWDSGVSLAAPSGLGTTALGATVPGAVALGAVALGAVVLDAAAAAGASTPATATAAHAALASLLIFMRLLPAVWARGRLARRLVMVTMRSGRRW